jgi:hypothetical protein
MVSYLNCYKSHRTGCILREHPQFSSVLRVNLWTAPPALSTEIQRCSAGYLTCRTLHSNCSNNALKTGRNPRSATNDAVAGSDSRTGWCSSAPGLGDTGRALRSLELDDGTIDALFDAIVWTVTAFVTGWDIEVRLDCEEWSLTPLCVCSVALPKTNDQGQTYVSQWHIRCNLTRSSS